jgi:hypothetical protein
MRRLPTVRGRGDHGIDRARHGIAQRSHESARAARHGARGQRRTRDALRFGRAHAKHERDHRLRNGRPIARRVFTLSVSLAPGLAHRIDRLARRAHAFHRFAHHPLCLRYEGEVIRVGPRARMCRGCTLSLLGSAMGAVAGAFLGTPSVVVLGLAFAIALGAWSLGLAGLRASKIATRLVPLCGMTFSLSSAVHSRSPVALGIAAAGCASTLVFLMLYAKRGPNRSPCLSCPERTAPKTCSGFQRIVRREKAVMRKTAAMIRSEGRSPDRPSSALPLSDIADIRDIGTRSAHTNDRIRHGGCANGR